MLKHIVGFIFCLVLCIWAISPSPLLAQTEGQLFEDVTEQAGLDGSFVTPGKEMGQAVGDVNNDGWLDLYLVNHRGPNRLYLNQGPNAEGIITFQQANDWTNVSLAHHPSGDAVFIDFDNDGWRDLYVIGRGPNILLRNLHGNGFQDVTELTGVAGNAMSRSATWGDYNHDGWLDLYVVNWACYPLCGRPFTGQRDRLYQSNGPDKHGNVTFRDVSDLLGVKTMGAGFAANFFDMDNDGDLDLYLVNDEFIHPIGNVLWRNDGGDKNGSCGGWCFTDLSAEANVDTRVMGMGLAIGDYGNDGAPDLFFTNAGPMALFHNNDGAFYNVAQRTNTEISEGIGWSATFLDFDNDSWQDLFVAVDKSTRGRVMASSLLRNQGDGTFMVTTSSVESKGSSVSSTAADLDNDGWVDLVVGNHKSGYHLYLNRGAKPPNAIESNWISLSLVGSRVVNQDAVGTRAELTLPDGTIQSQQVIRSTSLGADGGSILHFGLGVHNRASVTIRWPDGTVRSLDLVAVNRRLHIGYGDEPDTDDSYLDDSYTSTTPSLVQSPLVQGADGFPWWNDTVFYEIFVRSFRDSDGDGIGDLNGLIEKLDYLNDGDPTTTTDLGVTGIWLMPIMESPSYHGYDVVDYYAIDQEYGSMADFQRLMTEAHARGIRVVVDLVLNHTSRAHPWFKASLASNAEKRDWYIWSTERQRYRGPWGQPVWHNGPGGYYYGVFWEGMPDLNFENPLVSRIIRQCRVSKKIE